MQKKVSSFMRKVIASEYVTLDGVMEDPGGAEGFKYGGWSFQFWSEEAGKYKYDELFASDALLLGRITYQGFAAAWPTMEGTGDFGERMNSLPKYVVSTTLEKAEWNNSTIIKANVVEEVSKLKAMPGQDILIGGSGVLVHTLTQHNLIDEYRLMVYPVVLGSGKRFFKEGTDLLKLQLAETKTFSSGVIVLTYHPVRKEEEKYYDTTGK
jgi:dihydrofolate reductase